MAKNPDNDYRDAVTGQYSHFGNFDRMCICGHRLGEHIAGGFECQGNDYARPYCECSKLRQKRSKGKKVIMTLEMAVMELLSVLEKHGEWEDSRCFYFNGTAAPELQSPMKVLSNMLEQQTKG